MALSITLGAITSRMRALTAAGLTLLVIKEVQQSGLIFENSVTCWLYPKIN
tara:strand:+ start:391 stop:543 length:153 start_codon:yes stop_codon:yes gene_type:complete